MNGRSFFVRYSESFLQNSKHILDESALKQLSCLLCDGPFDNEAHPSIESLYSIEWMAEKPESDHGSGYLIWYVANEDVDHIEVISITTKKDDGAPDSDDKAAGFVRHLVRVLYRLKKLYEKWSDDHADGPDFIDFGL